MPRACPARRLAALPLVLAVLVAAGATGCSSTGPRFGALPMDLPSDPSPCVSYCKEWVPPVYRDRAVLVCKRGPHVVCAPERVVETSFQEVCVKPRTAKVQCLPGAACDQVAVQVRPGGYKWVRDGGDCWKYCWQEPCYQWCNKVVEEKGIRYCTEQPPEFKLVPVRRETEVVRREYVPGEYEVKWVKELYKPGYWRWVPRKDCLDCDCNEPCPVLPVRCHPCPPGMETVDVPGVVPGCPLVN